MFGAQTKEGILILVFAIVVIASGGDMLADLSHGATKEHVLKELLVVTLSLLSIVWLLFGLRRQRIEIRALKEALRAVEQPSTPPDEYVIDGRKKLRDVVTQQFSDWGLTGSESEVGWMLLKGLSLKEIAIVRNTLEKTVRQQASSLYKKAGVSGRHAFSAWFMEDIL